MISELELLEGQLRECYGKVVYTHKTHEKCADLLFERHKRIKLSQIVLAALVTGGILTSLPGEKHVVVTVVSAVLSTVLLALNAYTKDYDLGEIAQKHRQSATDIWLIREKYLSLLTDLRGGKLSPDECRSARDALLAELHAVYTGAPSTNYKAYALAREALTKMEEMTFSDAEIDALLPKKLRRMP